MSVFFIPIIKLVWLCFRKICILHSSMTYLSRTTSVVYFLASNLSGKLTRIGENSCDRRVLVHHNKHFSKWKTSAINWIDHFLQWFLFFLHLLDNSSLKSFVGINFMIKVLLCHSSSKPIRWVSSFSKKTFTPRICAHLVFALI